MKEFSTPDDRAAERAVCAAVGHAFGCEVHSFGDLAPVDAYACRDGQLVGMLEIKRRTHAYGTYPTVYLSTRKYLGLYLASIGFGVPALYVIAWTDRTGWVNIVHVDGRAHRMGGRVPRIGAANDIEPVIEVPIAAFHRLDERQRS